MNALAAMKADAIACNDRMRRPVGEARPTLSRLMPAPKWTAIVSALCEYRGIPEAEIYSKKRTRPIAWVRHEIWFYMRRELPNYSLPMIGARFGADHTSVIHGIKRHAERINSGILEEIPSRIWKEVLP